jgi:asparagine synthase (glutamine-hydrolysing)
MKKEVGPMRLIHGQWTFDHPLGIEAHEDNHFAQGVEGLTIYHDAGISFTVHGFGAATIRGDSSGTNGIETNPVVVWNGRLDNAPDLARELGLARNVNCQDVDLVVSACARWGPDAFCRIKGDWALLVWDARERCLTLAKDPIGTRPLFYAHTPQGVTWSSSLAWLLRNVPAVPALNLEYLAGWLAFFPSAALTPYSGIQAIPPSHYVQFQDKRAILRRYWDFEPTESIRLLDEFEYEERFRASFSNSVRRRLRSTAPVLAELSGGMDSSSIVCVADALLLHETGLTPRLDTLSYYDDEEPNWNERPYFGLVEKKRGREGFHVPVDSSHYAAALIEKQDFAAVPAELGKTMGRQSTVSDFIRSQNYQCVLCGIGGDEFTGGVPTPIPELADLLALGEARRFTRQLMQWALSQGRPWIHILFETLKSFAPPFLGRFSSVRKPPSWLTSGFRRQFRSVLNGYDEPLTLWGNRPSFQENVSAVDALRRQLSASHVGSEEPAERCYPYLDCDFLQFLFNVPREQLVQPGRRRALMRRSLAGIVPDEILSRKRKAFVSRAPRTSITAHWENIQSMTSDMILESLGIVSSAAFRQALEDVRHGKEVPIVPIQRTLSLECWLRNLSHWGVLASTASTANRGFASSQLSARGERHAAQRISAS